MLLDNDKLSTWFNDFLKISCLKIDGFKSYCIIHKMLFHLTSKQTIEKLWHISLLINPTKLIHIEWLRKDVLLVNWG